MTKYLVEVDVGDAPASRAQTIVNAAKAAYEEAEFFEENDKVLYIGSRHGNRVTAFP